MEQVLIVSKNEKHGAAIEKLLQEHDGSIRPLFASSAAEARRHLSQRVFTLAVINAPLGDESGIELSAQISSSGHTGVLLFVSSEHADEIASKVERYGVFVAERPVNRVLFFRTLRLLIASNSRVSSLQAEKSKLQQKIEDMKLIDRAKCLLIERCRMTESDAHRHLEKEAMDSRISRRDVAKKIIKQLENES